MVVNIVMIIRIIIIVLRRLRFFLEGFLVIFEVVVDCVKVEKEEKWEYFLKFGVFLRDLSMFGNYYGWVWLYFKVGLKVKD